MTTLHHVIRKVALLALLIGLTGQGAAGAYMSMGFCSLYSMSVGCWSLDSRPKLVDRRYNKAIAAIAKLKT